MSKFPFALPLALVLLTVACVRPKLYKAEFAARNQAEAREKVLVQEVLDRRGEAATMVQQIGELNRTIGGQAEELNDLRTELNSRTQQLGESSTKLAAQLRDRDAQIKTLEQRDAALQKVRTTQQTRQRQLTEIKEILSKAYPGANEVTVDILADETVAISLPDKSLFGADGLNISATGKNLLKPIADLLAERPTLDADVVAYTDNSLPKDKTVKDTWDWSLLRATNVVRLLIREFNTNANQLTPVGRGEFYPVASNATPEGRLSNRRTVVVVRPVLPALPVAD